MHTHPHTHAPTHSLLILLIFLYSPSISTVDNDVYTADVRVYKQPRERTSYQRRRLTSIEDHFAEKDEDTWIDADVTEGAVCDARKTKKMFTDHFDHHSQLTAAGAGTVKTFDTRLLNMNLLPFLNDGLSWNDAIDRRPRRQPAEFKNNTDQYFFVAFERFWAHYDANPDYSDSYYYPLRDKDLKYVNWTKVPKTVVWCMMHELCSVFKIPLAQAYKIMKRRVELARRNKKTKKKTKKKNTRKGKKRKIESDSDSDSSEEDWDERKNKKRKVESESEDESESESDSDSDSDGKKRKRTKTKKKKEAKMREKMREKIEKEIREEIREEMKQKKKKSERKEKKNRSDDEGTSRWKKSREV
jgi:hypothetical protein